MSQPLRRLDGKRTERYRCVKNAATGQVCVQNVDVIKLPIVRGDLNIQDDYFLEFLEQAPEERAQGWSDTVEEAMEKSDRIFSDFSSDGDSLDWDEHSSDKEN
jgi:hypothetical protein